MRAHDSTPTATSRRMLSRLMCAYDWHAHHSRLNLAGHYVVASKGTKEVGNAVFGRIPRAPSVGDLLQFHSCAFVHFLD